VYPPSKFSAKVAVSNKLPNEVVNNRPKRPYITHISFKIMHFDANMTLKKQRNPF
jgi:hypothetical protein